MLRATEFHGSLADWTRLGTAYLLDSLIQSAAVYESQSDRLSLRNGLRREAGEGNEDAQVSTKTFPQERPGELADLRDAHAPRIPPLALHHLSAAVTGHLKIDIAVGAALTSGFAHLPSFPPEKLPDKPFELFCRQPTELGRPLDKMAPVARLNLNDEPAHRKNASEESPNDIHLDQGDNRPVERYGQYQSDTRIQN